ncbi:FecR family protein [Salegentibacter echinorum]|uniref:FecR family protein n=1 Tax=Salegentibacter echinorum TaxID=1073325 RepID=A0A1M5E3Q1_SALEC|nr:FecR domain-containing protein [Salegentibacter echinorum]SHF73853.1 FecR family protein [Salegentibacter echinorum]
MDMEKIIIKYLNNEASALEMEQLEKWLKVKANQEKYKSFIKTQYLIDRNYVPKAKAPAVIGETEKKRRSKSFAFLKYAAVFAAVILGGIFAYFNLENQNNFNESNQITLELEDGSLEVMDGDGSSFFSGEAVMLKEEQNKLVYKKSARVSKKELKYNTLRVPFGKTYEVSLTDGSEVTLNAGTELKYPVAFLEKGDRKVFLEGEAYFKVARDTSRPFKVVSNQMQVEVLGTAFNMTAYKDDDKTRTLLVSGKVSATSKSNDKSKEESVVLSPNQLAEITNTGMQVSEVKPAKYLAWIDGKIIFVNDSFEVIKNKLERQFNVSIENNYKALNELKISASFETKSIDEVLQTFQKYKDFKYEKEDNKIVITKP